MIRPVKVLSINGWCRNGSTIIGNLLNEVDGFFHVGELHFLWKNPGTSLSRLPIRVLPLRHHPLIDSTGIAEFVMAGPARR
jgi:hypothetical protein